MFQARYTVPSTLSTCAHTEKTAMTSHTIKAMCAALLLCALAALAAPAHAAPKNVLFLSTADNDPTGVNIIRNTFSAFQAEAANQGWTFTDKRGALNPSFAGHADTVSADRSLAESDLKNAGIIIVETVYEVIEDSLYNLVANQMKTNPDTTFIIISDGCCKRSANFDKFVVDIAGMAGWGSTSAKPYPENITSKLNPASPYSKHFAGLPEIKVSVFAAIENVPRDFALYLGKDASASPNPPPAQVEALGVFIPKWAANGGACSFFVGDSSIFDANTARQAQQPVFAQLFMQAATSGSACKKAAPASTAAPVPATGWPALLGLGALLPWLARRRTPKLM